MAAAAIPRRASHRIPRETRRYSPPAGEIYYVKQIDNGRVRRVADPREKREFLLWLLVGVLLFAAGLVYTLERFTLIRSGYTIADLKGKRDTLVESNRKLRLEEASLRSPERIDSLARNLGLSQPGEGQVVRLENPVPAANGEVVVARLRTGVRD